MKRRRSPMLCLTLMLFATATIHARAAATDACVDDLSVLHLPRLAARISTTPAPRFEAVTRLASAGERNAYTERYYGDGTSPGPVFVFAYEVDGLRQYARLDLPADSDSETPVLVYAHGYVGYPASLDFRLAYDLESMSGEFIARWVEAGFAVLSPGYRGHGTFADRPAAGASYLALWDSGGTYLSPTFYALDILGAIEALPSIGDLDLGAPPPATGAVALLGHSQGGDAALTALAIDSFGDRSGPRIAAASLWAGCIGDRLEQLELYRSMSTPRGFLAGDGVWRRSPLGADGSTNPEFRWPWPQDWTAMAEDPQHGYQPVAADPGGESAAALVHGARAQLVDTVRSCIPEADLSQAIIAIRAASGHAHAHRIRQPLHLHTSDRDYYSPPAWNRELAERISIAGAHAEVFIYAGNTHALRVSDKEWFSPPGTEAGLAQAIARDALLFRAALLPPTSTNPATQP